MANQPSAADERTVDARALDANAGAAGATSEAEVEDEPDIKHPAGQPGLQTFRAGSGQPLLVLPRSDRPSPGNEPAGEPDVEPHG